MNEKSKQTPDSSSCDDGTEYHGIDLYDYWRIIWKRRKMIAAIIAIIVLTTIAGSFLLTDIYRAHAVIIPVIGRDGSSANGGLNMLAQQLGGLPVAMSQGQANTAEIVSLLNSNILKRKMIEQQNLMPILFYDQWDSKRQTWKQGFSLWGFTPFKYLKAPRMWDALRLLNKRVTINRNIKENTITISVDFHDPTLAARIADDYLLTLTNHMSSEAKRVAATNRKYLEEQLGSTADPFIKQKTYNLIAQQIENGMMAEVKENFAFKVIDPPLPPDKKIKPKRSVIAIISFVVSLFIGIATAFCLEYYDKIHRDKREVEK